MKPRLQGVQWIYEDIQIWTAVAERFGAWLTGACCESDSRDAYLMYRAQLLPGASDLWLPSTLWAEVRGRPLGGECCS
jgi:hypothetical protein